MTAKTISDILSLYRGKLDQFDLELLIAHSLKKPREFVLAYLEYEVTGDQLSVIKKSIKRRFEGEPVAYITERKEFFGLDFEVNKFTLIPRPETEMLVEQALQDIRYKIQDTEKTLIADIGTGSGCIIISVANSICHPELVSGSREIPDQVRNDKIEFIAIDISKEALKVAKQNAKKNKVAKKIEFLHGDLLSPLTQESRIKNQESNLIILANLPYLSDEIYENAPVDVKNFEPKSALYSPDLGLAHYKKLFTQIQNLLVTSYELRVTILIEFSPEQKEALEKMVADFFPNAKSEFKKDLAGKWRMAKISLN